MLFSILILLISTVEAQQPPELITFEVAEILKESSSDNFTE